MKNTAELKTAEANLERTIIYLETRSFAVLLTDQEKEQLATAKKELDIIEKQIRLEELRAEIQAERISTGELCELQSLAPYIDKGDVELLEAAGVPEFEEEPEETYYIEYLNAAKRHARDRVEFNTYNEAVIWGKANLENFNSDMIRIKR